MSNPFTNPTEITSGEVYGLLPTGKYIISTDTDDVTVSVAPATFTPINIDSGVFSTYGEVTPADPKMFSFTETQFIKFTFSSGAATITYFGDC